MKTLDKCKEFLEQQDGVDRVEVVRDEFLHARFASCLNPTEPHDFIVQRREVKVIASVS